MSDYYTREAEYRLHAALNQSALKPLRKSPLHAKHATDNPVKQTPAMALGVLTERIIAVPDDLRAERKADGRTKEGKAQAEQAEAFGILLVSPDDWQRAEVMAANVLASKQAQELLSGCEYGVPCYWTVGGQQRKALFDAVDTARHRIVDIKTTSAELTADSLARTAAQYGYHIQAAWYRQGYAAVHGVVPEFWFLFVESAAPHAVVAVQLDDDWLAEAADEVETMAAVWQQCADAGIWPGPAEMMADAGKLTLTRPRYAQAYTVGE